jgi:hypothetical protein
MSRRPWSVPPGAASAPFQFATYTVATVPAASANSGRVVILSDGFDGAPCLAYSNGTDWYVMAGRIGKVASAVPVYTIASGAITVTSCTDVPVDTEAAAATDDLDNILGTIAGQEYVVRSVNSSRDVTLRSDGTSGGNLRLAGGVSFTLTNSRDRIVLRSDGTNLTELSRSDNA